MGFIVTPHLNFRGEARAALDFYRDVFGGEQVLMTYGQMGQGGEDAADRIIWGQVSSDAGFRIMAFDILEPRPYDAGANAFFVSVRGGLSGEVRATWDALADGAEILQPLAQAPWSALYGMLKDRFGVTWIVDVEPGAA
jgi:PhnB protein